MTLDGLELVNISISEHSKLIEFAKANDIAWSFIGPDDALAAGIVDDFNKAGLKAFGPTRAAAELEACGYRGVSCRRGIFTFCLCQWGQVLHHANGSGPQTCLRWRQGP